IDELIYFGNDRGNTYNVESVASDTTVKLFGGAGNDTFRLAPTSKNLNDICRSVLFVGGNGFDLVEADDRNDPAAATFRIDAPFLSRNGKGVADVNGGMDELRVLAGSGSDTFNVERTAAEVPVRLFGNSGADTFRLSPTA